MSILLFLWPLVCAFLNRVRGGMFGEVIQSEFPYWGTTVCRLITAFLMILPLSIHDHYITFLLSWAFLSLGFIPGWKAWQSMTNIPKDIWSLSLRGLVLTAPIGLLQGYIPLVLVGLLLGPLYYIGTYLPALTELDHTETLNNSTWGEYLFGAALGFTIVLTAL